MNVIVIDDKKENVKTATEALSAAGCEVETYTNPSKGLERIQKRKADLVITDLMFPVKEISEKLNKLYRKQIKDAKEFLKNNIRWNRTPKSEYYESHTYTYLFHPDWNSNFICGNLWPSKHYDLLLEKGFVTAQGQGYEKTFGTVLFETARNAGLETILVSSMHRHEILGSEKPDFRQLVLPIMMKFPDLVLDEKEKYSSIGMNSRYIIPHFNKLYKDCWLMALQNILNPFAFFDENNNFKKEIYTKEGKDSITREVNKSKKNALEKIATYKQTNGADWILVNWIFNIYRNPEELFKLAKEGKYFENFDIWEEKEIAKIVGRYLEKKGDTINAFNHYCIHSSKDSNNPNYSFDIRRLAKQFAKKGVSSKKLSDEAKAVLMNLTPEIILDIVKEQYKTKNKIEKYTSIDGVVVSTGKTAIGYQLNQQDSKSTGCLYYRGISVHNGKKEITVIPIQCFRDRYKTKYSLQYEVKKITECDNGKYLLEIESESNQKRIEIDFKTEEIKSLTSTYSKSKDTSIIPFDSKEGEEFIRSYGFTPGFRFGGYYN